MTATVRTLDVGPGRGRIPKQKPPGPGGETVVFEGDAVRMTRSGGQRITARMPSEVLVWEMHARLGGP